MSRSGAVREPTVAASFYPARPAELRAMVQRCLRAAPVIAPPLPPTAVLVPHAGLVYSGSVAAAGWRALLERAPDAPTIVILGTNHSAWFDGVAVFEEGVWRTPLGDLAVDSEVAGEILALGAPFGASQAAHRREHSIEVQLPVIQAVRPDARIVPCSVAAGTDEAAIDAGRRLGTRLADLRARGAPILLAISTDMAHYPPHDEAVAVTERLTPSILGLDARGLAAAEDQASRSGAQGIACGMCGIQPSVLGIAAVRAMGAAGGVAIAASTSADAGGDPDRTVGYLSVAFA